MVLSRATRLKLTVILAGGALVISIVVLLLALAPHHGIGGPKAIAKINSSAPKIGPPSAKRIPYVSGTPIHLDIPQVSISLNIIPGYYNSSSKSWTLSSDKAQYGVMTAPANNTSGMTFIYAHNRSGVFASLLDVRAGAEAIIKTDNGHLFTYVFRTSIVTDPYDTSMFKYTGPPILLAQTCSGEWYQNRQLFIFDFLRES